MGENKMKEMVDIKFELVVPERIFMIHSLKEAKKIIEKYKLSGFTIRRIK